MVHKGTPLRRMAASMELPPPSPSQAPSFSQPTLEADDFVRWGKDLRSGSSGSVFASSSGCASVHVSRTSSSDSSLFPEDLSSEPEDSHSTVKPVRRHSRRFFSRISDSASQSDQSPNPLPSGRDKPSESSQPNLVKMLKGVSEVLEENTRLRKKRLEREARKSRLKSRASAKPYDVAPTESASSASGRSSRRASGSLGKETAKPPNPEPMSVDPVPNRSRKNTVSKSKGKQTPRSPIEDIMDVDSSVTLGDISMSEDPLPKSADKKQKSSPPDSQSSVKMMPPPPVPSKALKQSHNQKSLPKPTPTKPSKGLPPPTPPPLTQSNPPRRRTLGMTRTTTQTSAVSHSILSVNRKPFKSPLIKQEPGPSQTNGFAGSQTRTYPKPTSPTFSQPIYPTQKPAKATSKPPKPKKDDPPEVTEISDDPDTSYDFSTSSIDGEEFNKAMEEFDRGLW